MMMASKIFLLLILILLSFPVAAQENEVDAIALEEDDGVVSTESDEYDAESQPVKLALPDPTYVIENIDYIGIHQTALYTLRKITGLDRGMHVNLKSLSLVKDKLLDSALFEEVAMDLAPGSSTSMLNLGILVKERPALTVNDFFLHLSSETGSASGVDVSNINFFGLGHSLRLAFVASNEQDLALEADFSARRFASRKLRLSAAFAYRNDREKLFVPRVKTQQYTQFEALDIRTGLDLKIVDPVSLQFGIGTSVVDSQSDTELPPLILADGKHYFGKLSLSVIFDSTDHAFTPTAGLRFELKADGARDFSKKKDYLKLIFDAKLVFNVRERHLLRIDAFAGHLLGNAPFYERFFVGDISSFISPRYLGVHFGSRRSYDIFGIGMSTKDYENTLFKIGFEYAFVISSGFKNSGTEIFIGTQLFSLNTFAEKKSFSIGLIPDNTKSKAFPVDMSLNFGLRFTLPEGNFRLTTAKALELLPR